MTNIINLDPTTWSKQDWRDAYESYCAYNKMCSLSKQEYYYMVLGNYNALKKPTEPLSDELRNKWITGWRNAVVWAKNRKCDFNGMALKNNRPEINLEELQNDVRDLQWEMSLKR